MIYNLTQNSTRNMSITVFASVFGFIDIISSNNRIAKIVRYILHEFECFEI